MSYYCSKCQTNWPPEDEYRTCPDCDQYTFTSSDTEPNASVVEQRAVGTQTTDSYGWRVERYLELGFTEADAHLLASATEHELDSQGRSWTRPLNWHKVAETIEAGCSRALAVSIFG